MVEYIERMSAVATACKGCNKEFSNEPCEPSECHIQQGLFNIPAADVVEVVRCKDCKLALVHPFMADSQKLACTKSVNWRAVEPGHFCSFGERRTDV